MFSAVKTQPARISDWLQYEEDELGRYSRDIVTLAPNQTLASGTPLSVGTGTGMVAYDNATTGATVATAILVDAVVVGATAVKAAAIVRHAKVAKDGLSWKSTVDGTGKTAGMADLATLGIIDTPLV